MKKKILFLGTNRIYINNTQQLLPLAILNTADVTLYGPGYVSDKILSNGVESFIGDIDYDFIYTDGMILFWNDSTGLNPFKTSYNYFSFDNLGKQIKNMRDFFIKHKGKKLFFPNIDFYHVSNNEINLLLKSKSYLITWGIEFLEYIENLNTLKDEVFADKANDNWIKFIENNPTKIISLPHIISEKEFSYHPIENRKYDITVPGVSYFSRILINKIINKNLYKVNNRNSKIFQKINTRLLKLFPTRVFFKIHNQIFNNTIEDSKIAYTCGSGLDYLIRKFFEIPAKGTLLICKPFKGFSNIGFIDGENCVIVNHNNVKEKVDVLLNDNKKLIQISKKGQQLVLKNHSFTSRSKQLRQSINKILEGSFKGSYWKDGNYFLR